jgi:hypothetical protein
MAQSVLDQRRITLDGGGIYICMIQYDANENPIYIGLAVPGTATSDPLWQIRHLTFDPSNNPTSIQYANGVIDFNFVWDNRATLSYS